MTHCTLCKKETDKLWFNYITDPDLYCHKCIGIITIKYCVRIGKGGCCNIENPGPTTCPGHQKYLKNKGEIK